MDISRLVIDHTADGILGFDTDCRYTVWNPAMERLWGMKQADVIGRRAFDVFPFLRETGEDQYFLAALAGQPSVARARSYRIPETGRVGSFEGRYWPVVDGAGGIVGGMAIIRDLTAVHDARLRAEESDERFRQLTENLRDVFYITDPHVPRVEYVSPAYERIWGRPAASLYAHAADFLEAVHPDDRDRVGASLGRQAAGDSTTEEYRVVQPDGRLRYVLDRAVPVRGGDGGISKIVGVVTDVTDRRIAEEALVVSEARFRAMFEQSPFSVQIVAPEGETVLANPAFETLWGVPRSALDNYNLIQDPQVAELGVLPYLYRALDGEVAALPPVYYDPARSGAPGRPRWTEAIFYPVKDVSGVVRELVLMHRDISDRVQFEQERAELLAELQDANTRKDEFLATLGHELRNPLAPLITAAELLRLREDPDPTVRQAHEVIARQAQQMRRLIDDLLDVARITRGIISLHLERLDLRDVVREAVTTARPMLERRDHALTLSLPDGPVYADIDRVRIEQVVTNLLSNAAKFTPRSGRVEVTLTRDAGQAELRVADSGKGIPRDMLSRVFDLFTQVNPSLDRAEGGLGLGLTLVRRLVELHGGTVVATSEGEHQGAQFVVRIPMAPAPPDSPGRNEDAEPSTAPTGVRVLVVDDNVDSAEMLSLILPIWGYQTAAAHTPEEALSAVASFRPAIILLDIGLPGMSGYELAGLLRNDPRTQAVPLVALTGYGQDEDRRRTKEAGFAAHLTKPVDMDTLRGLLKGLIPDP